MHLPKFLLQIITEPDNHTVCIVRISALAGIGTFFGLSLAQYHQHAIFDPQAWALGFGGLLAGVGAALKMKPDTPIKPPDPPQ